MGEAKGAREARLAAALRENLKRRKAAARTRGAEPDDADATETGPGESDGKPGRPAGGDPRD